LTIIQDNKIYDISINRFKIKKYISLTPPLKMSMKLMKAQLESNSVWRAWESRDETTENDKTENEKAESLTKSRTWEKREHWDFFYQTGEDNDSDTMLDIREEKVMTLIPC